MLVKWFCNQRWFSVILKDFVWVLSRNDYYIENFCWTQIMIWLCEQIIRNILEEILTKIFDQKLVTSKVSQISDSYV